MKPKPKLARAVRPNAGVEAWYRKRLQTLVRAMSQDMLDRTRAAWHEDTRTLLGMDASKPTFPTLIERALSKWGTLWTRRINAASTNIAWNFATKNKNATEAAMVSALKDAGFAVRFKPGRTAKVAYEAVVAENVGLIKSIPQKYLTDVQGAVWRSVMEGGDLSDLTKMIQEKYGVAHRRAALIALDQNNKAKAAMERARRLELGISKAQWKHSHAGKVPRPTHVKMNDKLYDIKVGMYDSAEGKNIWPGVLIRCRCFDRSVIPGFE